MAFFYGRVYNSGEINNKSRLELNIEGTPMRKKRLQSGLQKKRMRKNCLQSMRLI